ncbi:MAG: DMT family transporter [Bacteroidota bacterium]
MSNYIYYILAILAGLAIATQTGVNAQLRTVVGNPVVAALVSFLVGSFALLLYILFFQKESLGGLSNLSGISWHKWTGGLIGALYVSGVIIIAPRIGAANTTGLIVAGQILFALFLDHFGYLGFIQHPFNIMRLAGAFLLIAGVFLILKN